MLRYQVCDDFSCDAPSPGLVRARDPGPRQQRSFRWLHPAIRHGRIKYRHQVCRYHVAGVSSYAVPRPAQAFLLSEPQTRIKRWMHLV